VLSDVLYTSPGSHPWPEGRAGAGRRTAVSPDTRGRKVPASRRRAGRGRAPSARIHRVPDGPRCGAAAHRRSEHRQPAAGSGNRTARRERTAVGARRDPLATRGQHLVESLLLASAGAAGGTLIAIAATQALRALEPPTPVPVGLDVRVDMTVFLCAPVGGHGTSRA